MTIILPSTVAAEFSPPVSLLDELVLEHGPIDLLGRFFPRADADARERGVFLRFGSCADLVVANRQNKANWLPLVPVFDPSLSALTDDNSFCILAYDCTGAVIGAHAARLFQWGATNFTEALGNLSLFYSDPEPRRRAGERCYVTAARARQLTGRVVYSGAAWVHPSHRGLDLSSILPRVAKAYALTHWQPDFIASLMTEAVYNAGFLPRFGYNHIDWDVVCENAPFGTLRFAVVWMDMPFLLSDLADYVARTTEQIDARVVNRRTK